MIKKLQKFENMNVQVEIYDTNLEKNRKCCNDLVTGLHTVNAVSDQLLLRTSGMEWDYLYHKVNGASAIFFDGIHRLTHFLRHTS